MGFAMTCDRVAVAEACGRKEAIYTGGGPICIFDKMYLYRICRESADYLIRHR